MSDEVRVRIIADPLSITVTDKTSPTLEVNENPVVVNLEGAVKPNVNVTFGGGRGPIWLPGTYHDASTLAAILTGAITNQQLSQDLNASLDATTLGLDQARADLDDAITQLTETGDLLNTTVTRLDIAEDSLLLQASQLTAAELNISNAQVFIDSAGIRLTAAEGSLAEHGSFIATQEAIMSNEWTVKIQENVDGSAVVAGVGLLVYPNWDVNAIYEEDDYVWYNDNAYKCIVPHAAAEDKLPTNTTYWNLVPYATKSQFGVLADSFFVQTNAGGQTVPFLVYQDQVIINGDLIVGGLIQSGALLTNEIFAWSVQSQNYSAGVSGYMLNAVTGLAEFNNITMVINGVSSDTIWSYAYDPAARINANSTTISGGKITTGSIAAEKLAIGARANLVPDSSIGGKGGWFVAWIAGGGTNYEAPVYDLAGSDWTPAGCHTVGFVRYGSTEAAANWFDIQHGQFITIKPNTRYELSGYVAAHRCTGYVFAACYDSNGTYLGEVLTNGSVSAGGNNLNNFARVGVFFTTPANVAYAILRLRGSACTGADPYVWGTRFYLGEAHANQTTLSDWSEGGTGTFIDGGNIVTNTLHANRIIGGTITADKLVSKTITAASGIIGDLAVDTLQVAGRAITVPSISSLTSGITLTTSAQAILGIAISVYGDLPVIITASLSISIVAASGDPVRIVYVQIYRDATLIWGTSSIGSYGYLNPSGERTIILSDTPSAGAHTYNIYAWSSDVSPSPIISTRTIYTMEAKR